METPYRSPRTLSRFSMASLAANGCAFVLSVVIGIVQVMDPSRMMDAGEDTMPVWMVIQSLIGLLAGPTYLLSIVLFLVWLYRTYVNLPGLMSPNNEFSPGWAIGWWFIPFANLVKPFQAVRSVWAESDPEFDPDGLHFTNLGASAPTFMVFWWALWIISNVLSNISARIGADSSLDATSIGYIFIVSSLVRIAAAALAIKVVYEISERQDKRYARLGSLRQFSTPPPPPVFSEPQFTP